jgi:hypothetical protein
VVKKPPDKPFGITGRWGGVPADVLIDKELSRSARWLFAVLCTHADKKGFCRRSLKRIANVEGVSKRAVQKWLFELERAGRVVKHSDPGKMGNFEIVRDTERVGSARMANLSKVIGRRNKFGKYGRMGAKVKANMMVDTPHKPVNKCSPTREQEFTSTGVNQSSPEQYPIKQYPLNNRNDDGNEEPGCVVSPLKDNPAPISKKDCLQGGAINKRADLDVARNGLVQRLGGWEITLQLPDCVLDDLTQLHENGALKDRDIVEALKKMTA